VTTSQEAVMLRHTVLLIWKPEATAEQRADAAAQIASLPALVSAIRAFASGADIGIRGENYDFAVTADFDDAAGYLAYRDDPRHVEIVAKYIAPIRAESAAVQYGV
jgi:Stress responsive A/B Barrel Domain